jgi:hypothetical protein
MHHVRQLPRSHSITAHILFFRNPFLNTASMICPFQCLCVTSLGVVAAIVKMDATEVIFFVL